LSSFWLTLKKQWTIKIASPLAWVHFKIVSDSPTLHSRWPLLLTIWISSNGQNCSILSQNVPKFELYKHTDELFNMYYRIFYELWTDTILKWTHAGTIPTRFDLFWFSGFRGEDLNVIFYQNMPNLHNIFYELWTFVDFDRLCKLEKSGDEILKNLLLGYYWANLNQTLLRWFLDGIFYQNMPNLHNRYISAERKISQKNPEYMLNYFLPCSCR
jgi:hypothetical protein